MDIRKSLLFCTLICMALISCQEREPIPIETFSLNYSQAEFEEGQTLQLEVVVTPEDADVRKVTWTTSDNNIVNVTKKGLAIAIKIGSATITASTEGFEASCEMTVRRRTIPATDVRLDRSSMELYKNETAWLLATIFPENSSDAIIWTSSDPSIVEVSDQGKVVALGCGTAVITVTAGDKTATCTVTVTELIIPGEYIKLSSTLLNLNKGETEYLSAEVVPDNATDKDIVWSSSDPSVVSVNGDGKVTAEKGGHAYVIASAAGVTARCEVNVYSPVTAISLGVKELTIDKGNTFKLTAIVDPEDATDKSVTWKSLDEYVVSVEEDGTVHALKGGVGRVSAQAGDKTANCTITVIAPVETVTLNKNLLLLEKGCTEILQATVGPEDATDKTVFWSSSNPEAVSVNDYGKVTAESAGTAIITAKAGGITAECKVTVI